MKIQDIIRIADDAYPGGEIQRSFEAPLGTDDADLGDTLSQSIVSNLRETFEDNAEMTDLAHLESAADCLSLMAAELIAVHVAFRGEIRRLYDEKRKAGEALASVGSGL